MRKVLLSLAALAALGVALPAVTGTADAREVMVIKKHHHWDRDYYHGWHRDRHEGWRHHHDRDRVVIRAN